MKINFCFLALLLFSCSNETKTTEQTNGEELIKTFLASRGKYMALYFSNIDTAYFPLSEVDAYKIISERTVALQDSTIKYSRINISKADSFYSIYKTKVAFKDSLSNNYAKEPEGLFIIHHFQLDGKLWTDTFKMNFEKNAIIKATE
ncbi:MAG: hypothetical protein LH473_10315, partial [Chitinophagales bacterium]|nr:hypothetical protein [Chitinophagales bacterium]